MIRQIQGSSWNSVYIPTLSQTSASSVFTYLYTYLGNHIYIPNYEIAIDVVSHHVQSLLWCFFLSVVVLIAYW